jgi:dethiobiotin synthetase
MASGFIVAGTDTGIGKTVFCAALTGALGCNYWKPIQAGTEGGTDVQAVRKLSGLPEDHYLPSSYVFRTPCSPHRAAEIDGVEIARSKLALPEAACRIVVEPAGGLLVPITREYLQIEVMKDWGLPVVLCARTSLGTINHTLLSVAALRQHQLPIHGIAFIGDENADTERTICDFSGARRLGRLPWLAALDSRILQEAFLTNFRREDFD